MKKKKYLYILSQRYSGSTLLSFLLATHPEIATIGERRKFYTKIFSETSNEMAFCSCGQLFVKCPKWNAIKEKLLEHPRISMNAGNPTEFQLFENKFLNRMILKIQDFAILNQLPKNLTPFSSKMKKALHFNKVLTDAILEIEDKDTFLDSSKSLNQAIYLSQIPDYDFSIIWLTRDPRAQVYSALKYNDWTIEQAVENWTNKLVKYESTLKKRNIPYLNLSYELLCRKPKEEISRILDFVGLDNSKFSLAFRAQEQHIMGNGSMRLGKEDKIVERLEWKEKLSKAQIEEIEDLTKDYQRFYAT